MSVGARERGVFGLIALTAAVNTYWLFAGPLLARVRKGLLRSLDRYPALFAIACVSAVVVIGEPLWYRPVIHAFGGVPLPWREAVVYRADVNVLVTALILAAGWLRDSFDRALERQRQRRQLEAALADAELRLLALQLQPHFLFNTLQLAAEAAYDDIAEAREIARDLQTLLHRAFELEERSLVRVAEEIEFLASYVAIQRRRFGSRLHVDVRVAPEIRGLAIPPLLFQPLVENCIRHGIGPVARDGRVVVSLARDDDNLLIRVLDNGVGFAANNRSTSQLGLGLGVTRRRLDAIYGTRYTFETGSNPAGGASVAISIPIVSGDFGEGPPPVTRTDTPDAEMLPWFGGAAIAAVLGTSLLLVDVVGSAYLFETTSRSSALVPTPIAVWIPAQVLAFALGVVLWRGRNVRIWLQRRDAETVALNSRIDATRERVAELRSGKDVMLSALERLGVAVDAPQFDNLTLSAAEAARSLLATVRSAKPTSDAPNDDAAFVVSTGR